MKNVLVVDASPVFSEFLKDKFSAEKIDVIFIQNKMDSILKMISMMPDLIILDINETDDTEFIIEYLQKKKEDPNASRIPLIAAGPIMDKKQIAIFAKSGIQKYFIKPIKFDVFFESVGHILHIPFSIDTTPCVIDIHTNGNIVFIEIAHGLNREKISILRYKLSELITQSKLDNPKVIIMMTNLDLSFVDGINLELLLNSVMSTHKIQSKNIKVLSFSTFTKELISGHPEYSGIEVATDISQVLNSLVDSSTTSRVSDLITDKILTKGSNDVSESIEMRFSTDSVPEETITASGSLNSSAKKIAIVDDDSVILDLLASAFRAKGFSAEKFISGSKFLDAIMKEYFDLIILDIMMPGISGFETLKRLNEMPGIPPVFIYSQAMKKELIIQTLSLGAKQYFVKPQKPDVIVQKAIEVLNGAERR